MSVGSDGTRLEAKIQPTLRLGATLKSSSRMFYVSLDS